MRTPRPPPRIFIITAKDVDAAIIFRRGPSDWFHLLKWDMTSDALQPGAWFKGSMYPEKCDLSPDGELLLYFVLQGSKLRTSYSHAWTAVSRAPWLEALGLWPQGTTYGGGGRFLSDRQLIIRNGNVVPHEDHPAKGLRVAPGNPALNTSTSEVEGATWSGRDRLGRVIYAKNGRIFRRNSPEADTEIFDLCAMTPDPKAPPLWAGRQLE